MAKIASTKPKKLKQLTAKQVRAVEIYSKGDVSKAEALRKAGYSEGIARNPQDVFENVTIKQILANTGITEESLGNNLQKRLNSQSLKRETYPLFIEGDPESLTNEEIVALYEGTGMTVKRIVTLKGKDACRMVYYHKPNEYIILDALDKAFNLHGSYAPKKMESKVQNLTFSLSDIRKAREARRKEEEASRLKEAKVIESTNK